ncbi:hypothetical protein ACH5RR_028743 [Cinchona calisaya]|uniref:Phytocyanin domain-containing protein n=1 Tax=Cinchona calisaya TaxID=153742 RepID=A0ABD2YU52_9GENT
MVSNQQMALSIFLVTFFGFFLSFSQAYTFYVGGKDGWVLKPKEDYNQWAGRNRFQINDTLIFKYKKGYDDVLEVDRDDYFNCYKEKPFQALKDGFSEFKFQRSGPFYFISGHANNCQKGQRLIIVVLHPRGNNNNSNKATSPVAPNPLPPSPAATKNSPVFAPAPSPVIANSPSPAAKNVAAPTPPPVSPPSPVILHHLAPAPAPSNEAVSRGGSVGSFLGLSLFLFIVTDCGFF